MTGKRIYAQIETTRFIKDRSTAKVDQMISVLNNSLEGLTFDPLEPARKMQQGSALYSSCFINDFQWRQKRNKGRQNKGGTLLLECRTRVTEVRERGTPKKGTVYKGMAFRGCQKKVLLHTENGLPLQSELQMNTHS